jgi:pyridoxamine 5'-phosphate oxidase-like protein
MGEYHMEHAKTILKNIKYATIATASNAAKPWNSPVAYFYDEGLNIYWFSDKKDIFSKYPRE